MAYQTLSRTEQSHSLDIGFTYYNSGRILFVVDFTGSSTGTRLLASTFQSVTTRTAGFNTADLTAMTPTSKSVMIMLMLIGGSPGSTAGGMKTTTFAVLILNMVATFRQKEDIEIFGRRLDSHAIKNAATIVALYIIFSLLEGLPSVPSNTFRFWTACLKRHPLSEPSDLHLELHQLSASRPS